MIIKLLESKELLIGVTYDTILVIIDRLTKYAYFLSYKDKGSLASDFVYLFSRTILANYEILEEIIFDRDKVFKSKFS